MTYQKKGETDDNFIKLLSTSQRAKADSSPESIGLNSISKQTKKWLDVKTKILLKRQQKYLT